MYPYQKDAVDKLSSGDILCGGVGSGKSRTALAYYYILNGGKVNTKKYVKMKNPCDLYIITTARKRDTNEWDEELAVFRMGVEGRHTDYSNKIVVDSWQNIKKYKDVDSSFFIFDEQRVVGSGAWVKAFLEITRKNEWILLSATPGDTWMDYVPVFIANGFYKNRSEFIREHVVYKRFVKFPMVDKYLNEGRLLRYRNMILVDMTFERKTKSHHIDIWVDYNRDDYREVMRRRWNIWTDEPLANASEFCQALRRVVNTSERRSEAISRVFSERSRVIIFYNYNYELELLRALEWGNGVKVAEWNGHKHEPLPTGEKWVYLVQYTAGAEGWNCTKTDTIIFYSQNYSYKIMKQAAGRIDRLNTPYTDLYYYHIKTKSGIDLGIDKALREKKKFNERRFATSFKGKE